LAELRSQSFINHSCRAFSAMIDEKAIIDKHLDYLDALLGIPRSNALRRTFDEKNAPASQDADPTVGDARAELSNILSGASQVYAPPTAPSGTMFEPMHAKTHAGIENPTQVSVTGSIYNHAMPAAMTACMLLPMHSTANYQPAGSLSIPIQPTLSNSSATHVHVQLQSHVHCSNHAACMKIAPAAGASVATASAIVPLTAQEVVCRPLQAPPVTINPLHHDAVASAPSQWKCLTQMQMHMWNFLCFANQVITRTLATDPFRVSKINQFIDFANTLWKAWNAGSLNDDMLQERVSCIIRSSSPDAKDIDVVRTFAEYVYASNCGGRAVQQALIQAQVNGSIVTAEELQLIKFTASSDAHLAIRTHHNAVSAARCAQAQTSESSPIAHRAPECSQMLAFHRPVAPAAVLDTPAPGMQAQDRVASRQATFEGSAKPAIKKTFAKMPRAVTVTKPKRGTASAMNFFKEPLTALSDTTIGPIFRSHEAGAKATKAQSSLVTESSMLDLLDDLDANVLILAHKLDHVQGHEVARGEGTLLKCQRNGVIDTVHLLAIDEILLLDCGGSL
jgi:hypothetical protein